MSFADVLTSTKRENFVVKVKVAIMETTEKLYYMGHVWCCAGINAELDYLYKCSTYVVAYGNQGMKIARISSMECMDMFYKVLFNCYEVDDCLCTLFKFWMILVFNCYQETPYPSRRFRC
ncbi:hypothetical protein ACJIZ3_006123 [Penstemon smallii]|uniref:Uncharacterized protein n=1 Tax=Penstemon smallii TaxID=265156 RepID=A0ABD3S6Y1_9LAMI